MCCQNYLNKFELSFRFMLQFEFRLRVSITPVNNVRRCITQLDLKTVNECSTEKFDLQTFCAVEWMFKVSSFEYEK